MKPHRIAMVSSHPIQYLSPWFRELSQHPELDVTVLYGDDHGLRAGFDPEFGQTVRWDVDLGSGYRSLVLKNHAPRPGVGRFFGIWSAEVVKLLSPERFDAVVIQGWNYALYPLSLLAARWHRLPVLIRCESVENRTGLKRTLLRSYLGGCAAALAVSTANRRLLLHYGVPPERIFFSPYAVDGQRFALPAAQRQAARKEWRQRLHIDDKTPLLLFVGKLLPVKDPELLLLAFAALQKSGCSAHLCFCGEGQLREKLMQLQKSQNIPEVSFLGFKNQTELPALYAAADALVLPSRRETFGIVVLEAMHAGLPVVLSDGVGCAEDLLPPPPQPPSGLQFKTGDAAGLLHCLRELCDGPLAKGRRESLATGARARSATWTYAESTRGLLEALEFTRRVRRQALYSG